MNAAPLCIFVSFSGQGGVERMVVNLAAALHEAGHAVDLVLVKAGGRHVASIPAGVRVVRLEARHTLSAVPAFARYLRQARPRSVLAVKDRAGQAAILARWIARVPVRLVIRIGTTVSAALAGQGVLRSWAWKLSTRLFYRHADAVVAVSAGVARDIAAMAGLAAERIHVVANPVVTPDLAARAAQPAGHAWLDAPDPGAPPVVLAVGRFTRQKDFPTLIAAFARLRAQRAARLVILGQGRDQAACEALAARLGIAQDCDFPGFAANPYAFMSRARLFVLSSRWEGSPNVLTEALALGTPVVATDCPSGPREILAGGRFGPLVPVGDPDALAAAMAATLDHPLPAAELRAAVREFDAALSAGAYARVLLEP